MLTETKRTDLFGEYYAKWITVYKKGAIRKVTMDKYLMTQKWLVKLVPNLRVCDMNRIAYQQLLNDYAEFHLSLIHISSTHPRDLSKRVKITSSVRLTLNA